MSTTTTTTTAVTETSTRTESPKLPLIILLHIINILCSNIKSKILLNRYQHANADKYILRVSLVCKYFFSNIQRLNRAYINRTLIAFKDDVINGKINDDLCLFKFVDSIHIGVGKDSLEKDEHALNKLFLSSQWEIWNKEQPKTVHLSVKCYHLNFDLIKDDYITHLDITYNLNEDSYLFPANLVSLKVKTFGSRRTGFIELLSRMFHVDRQQLQVFHLHSDVLPQILIEEDGVSILFDRLNRLENLKELGISDNKCMGRLIHSDGLDLFYDSLLIFLKQHHSIKSLYLNLSPFSMHTKSNTDLLDYLGSKHCTIDKINIPEYHHVKFNKDK
ncbi:hypothetical protein PPL_02368 [Heterostelium album PN500]|uniref:Uncharacterized protein n=1 Tax=Heterostelium pallidum (strain ATCC 26659 / Pp 5 / PN500) TaxID=670386 RepID=D3AZI6_HETP5|nr:hypothetical protein PPL_02368 [Heterostelium album PN500]EFA85365.1 hypothetical protein PPL_02368 [Heterostelium album PN500]|eukprot:XP_020437474.1 hypothetical protein PPL_02368 [Heterostelium album PN500]